MTGNLDFSMWCFAGVAFLCLVNQWDLLVKDLREERLEARKHAAEKEALHAPVSH